MTQDGYNNANMHLEKYNKVYNSRQSSTQTSFVSNLEIDMYSKVHSERIRKSGHFFAIGAGIINQRVNFNDVCKNSQLSNLHIVNFKDYVLLKEYM